MNIVYFSVVGYKFTSSTRSYSVDLVVGVGKLRCGVIRIVSGRSLTSNEYNSIVGFRKWRRMTMFYIFSEKDWKKLWEEVLLFPHPWTNFANTSPNMESHAIFFKTKLRVVPSCIIIPSFIQNYIFLFDQISSKIIFLFGHRTISLIFQKYYVYKTRPDVALCYNKKMNIQQNNIR